MAIYPRIAARTGNQVALNASFYAGGQLADPYAIRQIDIYRTTVAAHNLIATIPMVDPGDSAYPSPLTSAVVGVYQYDYDVPTDAVVPDVYLDVWRYFATNPAPGSADPDLSNSDYDSLLLSCCHRFWAYAADWICDDQLQTIKLGFEPLDIHFHQPEVRRLEVGMMPLPLYDYNFNLVTTILPMLSAVIRVETRNCELLVDDEAMTIGLRQGSYRSNPFVLRWDLDTNRFLIGTYRYRVIVTLPDGSTRASPYFNFTVD